MVDIDYLQKNYIGYESGIINEAGFIREDFLKYLEVCEMDGKESAKGQWNDLYDIFRQKAHGFNRGMNATCM